MRQFPDFQMELLQASDFILSSEISRRAFQSPPFNNYGNIIRDIIEDIDRLADNCHMPEFTDHALPHICSLVKRISDWGVIDGWLSQLTAAEAGYLLFSTLVHDIGMLSQNPEDLSNNQANMLSLGLADIASWVRRTHVDRLEGLLQRLASGRFLSSLFCYVYLLGNDEIKKQAVNGLQIIYSRVQKGEGLAYVLGSLSAVLRERRTGSFKQKTLNLKEDPLLLEFFNRFITISYKYPDPEVREGCALLAKEIAIAGGDSDSEIKEQLKRDVRARVRVAINES